MKNPFSIQQSDLLLCTLSFFFIESCLLVIAVSLENVIATFTSFLVSGWLFWTFTEYSIQRFLIKKENICDCKEPPSKSKLGLQVPLVGFLGGMIMILAIGLNSPSFTFSAGFFCGFLHFTLYRYLLHRPEGKFILPNIQRAHILHHTRYPNRGYSFSTLFWDWLFDTMPPANAKVTDQMKRNYFE